MKRNFNIIFTIDESYIQHFTVALISVIENNKDIDLNIFVIHDIADNKTLNNAIAFFKNQYGVHISSLVIKNSVFNNYRMSLHFSKAVYFRLLIADIMPDEIDTALFLDSDLLVTGSLEGLLDLNFDDNFLFADNEHNTVGLDLLNEIGLPANTYFNAGVMLLNLKAWRGNNVSAALISTAEKYMDKLSWWDQDVLNIYFFNKWAQLPRGYNERNILKPLNELPVLIHFSGVSKPWQFLNTHPYKNLYWKYLKLSPFKNNRYKDYTIKNFIKKILYLTGLLK
jgi:lipopolysaccharide biosynthesis glycosyltransferase